MLYSEVQKIFEKSKSTKIKAETSEKVERSVMLSEKWLFGAEKIKSSLTNVEKATKHTSTSYTGLPEETKESETDDAGEA